MISNKILRLWLRMTTAILWQQIYPLHLSAFQIPAPNPAIIGTCQKPQPPILQRQTNQPAYLTATVFLAGAVTMAVEFGASRLLGNVFGTSNIVWAVVIGLVLVYLTPGNWLGRQACG